MRLVLVGLFVCLVAAASSAAGEVRAVKDPAAGSYIVVFKSDAVSAASVGVEARQLAQAHGGTVSFVYRHALEGFAVKLSAAEAAELASNPSVAYVERDQVVHAFPTQAPATWGLDRIDQRNLPLSNSYTYNQTGAGVHAYIIDTGIRATHQEFTGRMGNGADFVGDGQGTNDCHGHGTHVAGTTGGTTYGVAKSVTLHAVRVLNCQGSGTNAGVIAGIDWVTANSPSPAVANMSLGGGASSAVDNAVANSTTRASAMRSPPATRTRMPATPRRPGHLLPTPSARLPRATHAPPSPTGERASTSSRRAPASPRRGARATPRRTRSAERRWLRHTWPARSRSTCRRTQPPRRRP